ncbi:hypothetical protein EMIHUDRAFT_215058 [Emiliania huxleyi CCMP1516]|uniref:Uncharacterized protein n=2 Tax=Emiliania huxleyi TaxID=2903 RepID=A0A0D3IIV3_EMIH1|nr:hypothetical protein EMIHUDRAFT_215058 [Emiliania huxleyi CCMP1516]EOD11188.1 hypothetical protein EMIHUDRAFT_215058 [Emiliania huxleyi CCMP1516]|eukprot:XP_005763617.1 hypothetical protein EMIHUDRAFT_215058 [Emiliania huxleyi CCMP1516]
MSVLDLQGAVRVLSEAVGDSDLGRLCARLLLSARAPLSLLRGQMDAAALRPQLAMLDELLRELAREVFTTWPGTRSVSEPAECLALRVSSLPICLSMQRTWISGALEALRWHECRTVAEQHAARLRAADAAEQDAARLRRLIAALERETTVDPTSDAAKAAAAELRRKLPAAHCALPGGAQGAAFEALRQHTQAVAVTEAEQDAARLRPLIAALERETTADPTSDAAKAAAAELRRRLGGVGQGGVGGAQGTAREALLEVFWIGMEALRQHTQAVSEAVARQDVAHLRRLIAALERETTVDPTSDAAKAAAAELRSAAAVAEARLEMAHLRRLCAALDNEDPESDAAEAAAAELRRKWRGLPRRKLRESESQRLTALAVSDLRLVIRAALDRHCEAAVTARHNRLKADYLTALVAGREAPGAASLVQEKPEGSAPGLPEESEVPTAEASEREGADLAARVQLSGAVADLAARQNSYSWENSYSCVVGELVAVCVTHFSTPNASSATKKLWVNSYSRSAAPAATAAAMTSALHSQSLVLARTPMASAAALLLVRLYVRRTGASSRFDRTSYRWTSCNSRRLAAACAVDRRRLPSLAALPSLATRPRTNLPPPHSRLAG